MTNPKVSVIVPVYNQEKYIHRCVDSICAQTLREIEIILVDDGSTDASSRICDEYTSKDSRVQVIHKENAGMGVAYNTGMATARGEYIGFVETDDWIEPEMYEELYAKATEHEVDIVKSLYWSLDQYGKKKLCNNFPERLCQRRLKQHECNALINGHVSHWSAIYRRNYLLQNNICFNTTAGARSQDFGFAILNFAHAKSVYVIPRAFITYNLATGNHQIPFLNTCMLDECELTYDKLSKADLPGQFWEIVFRRISTRLRASYPVSNLAEKLRIRRLLRKMEKRQSYKTFTQGEKMQMEKFIHPWRFSNLKAHIFAVTCFKGKRTVRVFELPIMVSIDTPIIRDRRIFGISLSKKKTTRYYVKHYVFGCLIYRTLNIKSIDDQLKSVLSLASDVNHKLSNMEGIVGTQSEMNRKLSNMEGIVGTQSEMNRKLSNMEGIVGTQSEMNRKLSNMEGIVGTQSEMNRKLTNMESIVGTQNEMNRKLSNMESIVGTQSEMNRKLSNMKCIVEAQTLHMKSFLPYKNVFKDRNVVLVCTGPTAKYYEPMADAIHIGVNGAIYLEWLKLDYLFVQDYTIHQTGNENLLEDALSYQGNNCKKFFGIMPSDRLAEIQKHIGRIPLRYADDPNTCQYLLEDIKFHEIAYDLAREPIGEFGGTVFSALQFVLYTNPKTLYIVGWDCSAGYAYNKSQFFGPANYQLKILKKYFLPFIENQHSDMKIITFNPVGLKGIFNDLYTEKYLHDHPETEECAPTPSNP